MKIVYLLLGANLGDRHAALADAAARLSAAGARVLRSSSVYETEPQYLKEQPWFLNQVVEAETALFPRQLLARIHKIERAMGRKPGLRNSPRLIDIDILLFGQAVVATADLEIPHPRLEERRFALEPLAELAPGLRHPATGRTTREMLAGVKDQLVRKL